MKKFKITKQQILQLINCSNKIKVDYRLKEWFPQAFEIELEIGKWYKHNRFLLYIIDETHWYGFDVSGAWNDYATYEDLMTDKDLLPATDKEVETALIAEAKKLKLSPKNIRNISCVCGFSNSKTQEYYTKEAEYFFESDINKLWLVGGSFLDICIFDNGKWAEIISEQIELTLEQRIERIEEQLKIKK